MTHKLATYLQQLGYNLYRQRGPNFVNLRGGWRKGVMPPGLWTRIGFVLLAVVVAFLTASSLLAHAVLLESSPALKSAVTGPDVPLKLRFNVRIDAARSRLTLVDPDGTQQTLEIHGQDGPDTLAAEAKGLHPGTYRIRWQVLASDGHITRGEIPFTVKP